MLATLQKLFGLNYSEGEDSPNGSSSYLGHSDDSSTQSEISSRMRKIRSRKPQLKNNSQPKQKKSLLKETEKKHAMPKKTEVDFKQSAFEAKKFLMKQSQDSTSKKSKKAFPIDRNQSSGRKKLNNKLDQKECSVDVNKWKSQTFKPRRFRDKPCEDIPRGAENLTLDEHLNTFRKNLLKGALKENPNTTTDSIVRMHDFLAVKKSNHGMQHSSLRENSKNSSTSRNQENGSLKTPEANGQSKSGKKTFTFMSGHQSAEDQNIGADQELNFWSFNKNVLDRVLDKKIIELKDIDWSDAPRIYENLEAFMKESKEKQADVNMKFYLEKRNYDEMVLQSAQVRKILKNYQKYYEALRGEMRHMQKTQSPKDYSSRELKFLKSELSIGLTKTPKLVRFQEMIGSIKKPSFDELPTFQRQKFGSYPRKFSSETPTKDSEFRTHTPKRDLTSGSDRTLKLFIPYLEESNLDQPPTVKFLDRNSSAEKDEKPFDEMFKKENKILITQTTNIPKANTSPDDKCNKVGEVSVVSDKELKCSDEARELELEESGVLVTMTFEDGKKIVSGGSSNKEMEDSKVMSGASYVDGQRKGVDLAIENV